MRDRGNGSSLISHEGSGRRIAPKALAKFADPDITPRTGDVTLPQLIKRNRCSQATALSGMGL